MTFAYFFSLIFSLSIGILAAKNEKAEHIIIPLLDVLQSIPILGFFPIAIIFFINLFGSYIGAEISSIFLIFTSQVWNMTFGVYEAVKLIPRDVEEMARVYNIGRFLYVRKILVPATMTKLIYNSAMSLGRRMVLPLCIGDNIGGQCSDIAPRSWKPSRSIPHGIPSKN
jgi:NitT/TauT family transport system permease protein